MSLVGAAGARRVRFRAVSIRAPVDFYKSSRELRNNFRFRRAGIHLDSDGALANLVLPCLSLLATRMAAVSPPLHICPSPPFWRICPAGVSSRPIILAISLIFHHSSLQFRCASCRRASHRRAPHPTPLHSILTLKEKRCRLKGGYTRRRRASVSGEKQELKR